MTGTLAITGKPDEVTGAVRYEFDASDRLWRLIRFDHPGPDRSWATRDDRIAEYQYFEYHRSGELLAQGIAVSPGADRLWFTHDDLERFHRQSRITTWTDVRDGGDGQPASGDEIIAGYRRRP